MPETQLLIPLEETCNLLAQLNKYLSKDTIDLKELSERKSQIKANLESAKDNTEAQEFIKRYKDLKKKADALDRANMIGLKQLLKDSHDAAEKELRETKSATEQCLKMSAKLFDNIFQTKLAEVTSWLPLVQEGLNKLEDAYAIAISELTKKLKDIPDDIDKNIIISQASVKLNGILLSLKTVTTKYVSSKLNQFDTATATKTDKQFPCCMAFIRILMGISGISGKKDPASGETEGKEGKKGKEYVKIFGSGYLSKAVYNATRKLYDESKR